MKINEMENSQTTNKIRKKYAEILKSRKKYKKSKLMKIKIIVAV